MIPRYLTLFAAATVYALFLNTSKGRQFADKRSAESVVLGTLLVLGVLRSLLPPRYWLRVVGAFVVAGLPMIGRSWANRVLGGGLK